jgi:hypothetical protein
VTPTPQLELDLGRECRPRRAKPAKHRSLKLTEQLRRGITPAMRRRVFGEDGWTWCRYCQFPGCEIDHVVPVKRGGGLDPENLVPVCHECNLEKLDRTVEEWADARRTAGKPWPIPSFTQRIMFLSKWGIRLDLEKAGRRTVPRNERSYWQYRLLLVEARDHDLAELLKPVRVGAA